MAARWRRRPIGGPVRLRAKIAPEIKARLATVAVRLIEPDQLVYIDAGSTNIAIASAIPPGLRVTVATNAIGVAAALADHAAVRLIVLGGAFDAATGACLGAETLRAIDRLGADLVFLGACALDVSAGVTAFDAGDAEVKRAMVARSRAVAVAATADKLGTAAPYRVAPGSRDHASRHRGRPAGGGGWPPLRPAASRSHPALSAFLRAPLLAQRLGWRHPDKARRGGRAMHGGQGHGAAATAGARHKGGVSPLRWR